MQSSALNSSFLIPWILLFFINLSLPNGWVEQARSIFATSTLSLKEWTHKKEVSSSAFTDQLLLENQRLKENLAALYEWLLFESRLEDELDRLQELIGNFEHEEEILRREFLHRRVDELKRMIDLQSHAIMGKVIHRSPDSWGSSVWISVGYQDNARIEQPVVQKHSPVMAGPYLVGVIEEVEKERSRVRLISDSGLVVAVRAVRGKPANQELLKEARAFKNLIAVRDDLPTQQHFLALLHSLEEDLQEEDIHFLAKGEIYGNSSPIWDMKEPTLYGKGFQYEFSDEESTPFANEKEIIQKGDLLITSGLDGLFPSGIVVGHVEQVELVGERYYYNIEAKPAAVSINEMQYLFVLPPVDQ